MSQTSKPEMEALALAMKQAMKRKNMNASGVARAIWGTITLASGYTVAKNRDRIGQYLAAASYPKPETLDKLAKVLDLDFTNLTAPTPTPDIQVTLDQTRNGHVMLTINASVPVDVCVQVLRLIHPST